MESLPASRFHLLPAGDRSFGRLLARLASLRLTLAILIALGAGVLAAYRGDVPPTWALAVPLGLFALNLSAALAAHPAFRRQPALLVFHLALLVLVLLLAAGRMTYLKGHLELTEGEVFTGELAGWEAGPWHAWRLGRARFVNEGFRIDYAAGVKRGPTRNAIAWRDEAGLWQRGAIGDDRPLVLHGYRFYTSFNKGFAPTFAWRRADGGEPVFGSVHLPAWPQNEYRQARSWRLPEGGPGLRTRLKFDEQILDPARPSVFRPPSRHTVVVSLEDAGAEVRREMRPGEVLRLPQGELRYLGLRAWMGYTVFSDPTLSWLLAAAMVAVTALAWHLRGKYFARPWRGTD